VLVETKQDKIFPTELGKCTVPKDGFIRNMEN
jgi:hypothetical protein